MIHPVMNYNIIQANVPEAGAEARLSETGIVESQISAGQEEHDQATTAASAVEPTATQEQPKTLAAQMPDPFKSISGVRQTVKSKFLASEEEVDA